MNEDTYDYVIVGAGSAGAVLAARLTEDAVRSVLLLEAGGEADADEVMIPAAFPSLFKTRWDWNYHTTEQKQLNGRRAYWPRMKALGGCSSMNAMIYIRGNRVDYDSWRDQYGATGWGFDDLLPYFVRSESNTRLGAPLHGRTGPLHVEDRGYTHPLSHAFVASAVSAGSSPPTTSTARSRRAPGSTRSPVAGAGAARPTRRTSSPRGTAATSRSPPARWPLRLSWRASGRWA